MATSKFDINAAIDRTPLFADQWHLQNTGQTGGTPGADANIIDAWSIATGEGVVIAIVEDSGVQYKHPDLDDNYNASLSYDFENEDPDPFPLSDDNHATSVAGIAVGEGDNSLGILGSAPDATFASLQTDSSLFNDYLALGYKPQEIDIYNNSWSPKNEFVSMSSLTQSSLEDGVREGRGGLGSIYVFAGGNGNEKEENVNYNAYANSRYTIAVAAIDHNGEHSDYSEPGSPLLISGYSSNDSSSVNFVGITSTDNGLDNYIDDFSGTSAATPLVSGVIALMLEANPNLTYRDVQHILVETAELNDPEDPEWIKNGAGHDVNYKYGFGAIDATAAVNAALNWETVAEEVEITSGEINLDRSIPDDDFVGISSSFTVEKNINVEWVEIVFDADHPYRGDLEIVLTSPDGTESVLAESRDDSEDNYDEWTFTSARNWGESSLGDWTLSVSDLNSSDSGTWNSWEINLYGTKNNSAPQKKLFEENTIDNPLKGINVGFFSTPSWADIDKDGDLDAFIGEADGTIKYYENDGNGTFTEKTGLDNPLNSVALGASTYIAPSLVDIDGDGDLDAFIGELDGTINYYEQNSNGNFTEKTGLDNPLNVVDLSFLTSSTPSWADIDKDGDLDAFIGGYQGTINYYENEGNGTFTEKTGADNPLNGVDVVYDSAPSWADIDKDGDLDAFIGEGDGTIKYYENEGNGTFTEKTGADNPLNGVNVVYNSVSSWADIDEDGDLDAFIGEIGGNINYYEALDTKDTLITDRDIATTTTNLLDTFLDIDGDTLSISKLDRTNTIGKVTNNGDGTITYDPNAKFEDLNIGETTTDTFSYTVSDGDGGETNSTITVTINGVEDLLETDVIRFHNTSVPGTYLYALGEEAENIRDNFSNFKEEGIAFKVGLEEGDDLIPIYRFQSTINSGTYLFAGEEERININNNPNFYQQFIEEGLAFYVYGADSDRGTPINRLQNSNLPGTYLFAGVEETENIITNNSQFINEGLAFKADI